MKVCNTCNIEKDNDCFYQKLNQCKDCNLAKQKQYYLNNKEEIAEKQKQYYVDNKEEIAEKRKQYTKANKEKISQRNKKYLYANKEKLAEYNKEYREANKEELAQQKKKYYQANKEKIAERDKKYSQANKQKIAEYNKKHYEYNKEERLEYQKQYKYNRLKTDPIFKFKENTRTLINHSFKKKNHHKKTKTADILGCSLDFFKDFIKSKFKKGMTFYNHGKWHLDHIIPLATAKTEDDVIRLNHYTNFQPLWAKDNLSKSDKIIEQQLVLI